MSDADRAQLAAGGYVPTSTKLGKSDAVDTVVARAYRHAVLPGRTVIRLTAESVTAGDDLEMATLGFAAGEDRGAVAKERKRALGFPGWALVNDPKNARYALDVVKEFKKVARRAKSKPGNAKEGIDKIAASLGKTVPHFLPSFYEEAGRAFLEHGAPSFAAIYFGRAREAEAVHALEVDEQHRVDAFLEFALAGAVTTKALAQYAKELAEHHAPAVAYAHFRQLCVQRTLGGMPPWAGMAKDLQRLAKAAKLDVAAEDRGVVAEIIASPALGKAAGEFWRAYQAPIIELGKAQPAVRGAILNLFPTGSTYSEELDNAWLDLVEATGAIEALVGEGDAAAQPSGGRAAWFDKLTQHLARSWRDSTIGVRAFALLRRMAPRLIADGAPIRCLGRYNQIDLDLCELALELGVPVTIAADAKRPWMTPRFDLTAWSSSADKSDARRTRSAEVNDQAERGRDPVRTAAHAAMGPALVKAVGDTIGKDAFDHASVGKTGFLAAKRAWLEEQIAGAERGALPALVTVLERVNQKVKATLFADLPDLHARFAAIDVAPLLARSLVIGAIDELGWPALEAVMAELSPDGKTQISISGGLPALICCTPTKLVAVGPTGRLGEHDLVIPPKHELITARFIGGQFLVVLKEGYTAKGYWSSAPHDLFAPPDTSVWGFVGIAQRAAVLPDGGWMESGTVIRAGDRVLPTSPDLRAFDGTTAWVVDPADRAKWREVSATGEKGRASWPAVMEQAVEDGWQIDAEVSYVFPANGLTGSPLGARDGLVGVVALNKTEGEAKTVVARKLIMLGGPTWMAQTAVSASCVLAVPGASEPRVISEYNAYRQGIQTTIWDPSFEVRGSEIAWKERRYSRGQAAPLSPMFWHAYTVRDPAGSKRLRAVTTDDARALMAAIPVENGLIPDATPDEPIARVLPEVGSQPLRNGITGFAIVAVQAQMERDRLARERAPGTAAARPSGPSLSDAVIFDTVGSWIDRVYNKDGTAWNQISTIGSWFASDDRADRYLHDLPATELDWFFLAPVRSMVAFLALAIGTPAEHRAHAAALFGHLARSLPPGDKLRWYALDGAHGFPGGSHAGTDVRWHAGNAYAVRKRSYNDLYRVLEYAPDGAFKPPPSGRIYDELRGTAPGLPAEVVAELEAAIARGATSWSAEAAERIGIATGLSSSAAAYLWAGLPNAHDRGANFLDKDLREHLGLKAAQAALGRDVILAVRDFRRIAAVDAAARAGVAAMLDGTAATALADAWTRIVGKRVAVPEELIAAADRELSVTGQPANWLAMFAAPAEAPLIALDGTYAFDRAGTVIRVSKLAPLVGQDKLADPPASFDVATLNAAVQYLPFLYAELPVGDELRAAAPRAHELILARLANPGLWFEVGANYLTDPEAAAYGRTLDGLGGEALTGLEDGARGVRVPGAAVIQHKARVQLKLHPASIDAKAEALVGKLVATMSSYSASTYAGLRYLRSPGLAQMMARIRETPVAAGGWEQNPMASVPKLVDRAAKKLGVSREAAALYLQYLVLLWPTPKHIVEWNGWKPKQLADAQAELVAHELVIEAKRERAQRAHFLPGGWEALKAPHPPMESWKLALYGVRDAAGNAQPPHERFLALAPFHAMFEAAWERIEDDDTPRYDEVKR